MHLDSKFPERAQYGRVVVSGSAAADSPSDVADASVDGVVGTEVGRAGMGASEFQGGGTPAGIEGTGIEGGALPVTGHVIQASKRTIPLQGHRKIPLAVSDLTQLRRQRRRY